MTTTGTYAFDPQLAELFEEAWERAGADPAALGTNLLQATRRSMRFMLNGEWNTFGINQWQIREGRETITTVGKTSFYLPSGAIDIWDMVLSRNGKETEMYPISRDEYLVLTSKTNTGRPDRFFLDKTANRPRVFFWPTGAVVTDILIYNYFGQMQDATHENTSLKATLDMPTAAFECCAAGLAYRVAQKFQPTRALDLMRYYGGKDYPDKIGGTIELMRQALRDRADIDLYGASEPRTTRR